MFKKIIIFIVTYFVISLSNTLAFSIPVENVFSDIKVNYKYYDELQTLYDKWMITPDSNWKFNPNKLLNRDEFIWISMGVSCKKCITPDVSPDFINLYTNKISFFDVLPKNKYFYCIADAKNKNYIKWYDVWYTCGNWTNKNNKSPFCPSNKISLEEAIAVVLRNSGIFTIADNQIILDQIKSGVSFPVLSSDVKAKNIDGSVNSFYPYLRKALTYEYTRVDINWNTKIYKLLSLKNGKIRPKKSVTKEEFLRIAYVALKTNSCSSVTNNKLALQMKVTNKSNNTYDFSMQVWWVCSKWVGSKWYIWRFYNSTTWEHIIKYGKSLNNYSFLSNWNWKVYLRVLDNCWNTWEIFNTISITNVKWVNTNNNLSGKLVWLDLTANPLNSKVWQKVTFTTISTAPKGVWTYSYTYWDWSKWVWKWWLQIHSYSKVWTYIVWVTYTWVNWKISKASVTVNVWSNTNNTNNTNISWLGLIIKWSPIFGPGPLVSSFTGIVSWWVWPYDFSWNFWNGNTGFWSSIINIFTLPWVYPVGLVVTDINWLQAFWTTSIKVTKAIQNCNTDSDKDWINDCIDLCPLVPWDTLNNWCPILWQTLITPTLSTTSLANNCITQNTTSLISWSASCNTCPCSNFLDFKSIIRKCDTIFPAITSPDWSSIYSKWKDFIIK